MTSFDLDNHKAKYQIYAWGPGRIKINEVIYKNHLIITANKLIFPWDIHQPSDINTTTLQPALQLEPQILLIGTGATQLFLPPINYSDILTKNIGVEIMSTPAAARTFNSLTAEKRLVVAALLIP